MTSEVPTLRLKDCLSLLKDGTHNPPERSEKGIKFIAGATDIKYLHVNFSKCTFVSQENYKIMHKKWEPRVNDVLLTIVGTVGNTAIVREQDLPFTMQRSIATLRPNEKIDFRYLFYWLNSDDAKWAISSRITATGQPGIYLGELGKIPISIPRLEVQKKISEKLYILDQAISINRKIVEVIENKLNALFRSWFIDFDPVKAKAEGKLPYGMGKETVVLFPDSFEESRFGPIPAGWKWGYLGDCVSVVGGGTPSTKNEAFWGGEYNWTSPKDLSNSNSIIMIDTERTITEAGLAKISSGLLPKDTVLMSSRAPIGYLALTKIPVAINQGYIAIPPDNGMSPNFILSWIHYNMPLIEAYSSGATFPEISKKEFRKLPILIPPSELIEIFNEITTHLYDSIEISIRQINFLEKTRDALLPRMMSGELKVN